MGFANFANVNMYMNNDFGSVILLYWKVRCVKLGLVGLNCLGIFFGRFGF